MTANLTTRLLRGFDDPALSPAQWERLLEKGQTNTTFLTWQWQSVWWNIFGRGELLLIAAERDGEIVALAPLFSEAGMAYFVGSGGSDYLDFIGDISDPHILDALLNEARRRVTNFIGFVFYHVPETSETGWRLRQAAERIGLKAFEEGSQLAPMLEMTPENVTSSVNKKSLVRHEKFFARDGSLKVRHLRGSDEILPHLDQFFAQHIARWSVTPFPSLFNDEAQKRFYRALTPRAAEAGWLRFTHVEWQNRPVAFHFGFCRRGNFMWYKPTFDHDLAKHSPGEVLLRQLLLAAQEEGAHVFDFGLGDEAFKSRFATQVNIVRDWGLYEPTAVKQPTP